MHQLLLHHNNKFYRSIAAGAKFRYAVDMRRNIPTSSAFQIFTAIAVVISSAIAQRPIETPQEFDSRVTFFYLHPSKEEFDSLQSAAKKHEEALISGSDENGRLICGTTIAMISEKNGWPVTGSGKIAEMARDIMSRASKVSLYVLDDEVDRAAKLDIWWASFFATGDKKYLKKLLKLAVSPIPRDGQIDKEFIIGAAKWSFSSNCMQHEAVRAFAESQIENATSDDARKFLKDCASSPPPAN